MNCNEVTRRLDDYLDGEMDTTTASALRAHLDACPDCREQFAPLLSAVEGLGALPELAAPEGLVEGVMVRLPERGEAHLSTAQLAWLLAGVGAAAAALIAIGGLWLAQGLALNLAGILTGAGSLAHSVADWAASTLPVMLDASFTMASAAGGPIATALLVNVALLGAAAIMLFAWRRPMQAPVRMLA